MSVAGVIYPKIRRRLVDAALKPYQPANGPVLTAAHRKARSKVAAMHAHWEIEHWRHVLSRLYVSTNDHRDRVWRRQGEQFAQCAKREKETFGRGSVMVWAGITLAIRYRDGVIDPIV